MNLKYGHILFIEDHEDTREMVTMAIRIWGYRITSARTISEGLRLAQRESFDLYLFDGKLPDGTGVELCRQIREFDEQTPVVFYSASAFAVNKEEALAAGAQAYLSKPADLIDLESIVAKYIGRRNIPA